MINFLLATTTKKVNSPGFFLKLYTRYEISSSTCDLIKAKKTERQEFIRVLSSVLTVTCNTGNMVSILDLRISHRLEFLLALYTMLSLIHLVAYGCY